MKIVHYDEQTIYIVPCNNSTKECIKIMMMWFSWCITRKNKITSIIVSVQLDIINTLVGPLITWMHHSNSIQAHMFWTLQPLQKNYSMFWQNILDKWDCSQMDWHIRFWFFKLFIHLHFTWLCTTLILVLVSSKHWASSSLGSRLGSIIS